MSFKSIYILLLACCFAGCGNFSQDKSKESATVGHIIVAIDESLQPVIEQHLKVWDSSFPDGHITPRFLPEAECIRLLMEDSVKLIITARDLSPAEKDYRKANKKYTHSLAIAADAIAIIVNPKSQDDKMTLGMLREILMGNFPRKYTVVFDNPQSSLVRYMADSLLQSDSIPNAYTLQNSKAVVEYVAKNPDALGIVGLNYIYDSNDVSGAGRFFEDIKVVAVRNDSTYKFYQPYQYAIALKQYPLSRDIYFITSESYSNALASGFANFLTREQAQLIFKKSWMVPLRVQLEIRDMEITR